jgi:hypothetical protein
MKRKCLESQLPQRFGVKFDFGTASANFRIKWTDLFVANVYKNEVSVTNLNLNCSLVVAICLLTSAAWADTLELKNGKLINGKFMGVTVSEISFRVGSSVQKYDRGDIASPKFDSGMTAGEAAVPSLSLRPTETSTAASTQATKSVTIPAGTHISVRTIEGIDSTKSH